MDRKALTFLFIFFGFCGKVILADPPIIRTVGDYRFSDDKINYRLPNTTKPNWYRIAIKTNIDQGDLKFSGVVTIHLTVLKETQNITLHARKLKIDSASLEYVDMPGKLVPLLLPYHYDEKTEFLTFSTANQKIHAGNSLILKIQYNSVLRTDLHGFYASSYVNAQGKKTY